MRQYHCVCGGMVFYDNSHCITCGHELGFCPVCRNIVALLPGENGAFMCGNPACGAALAKCFNYAEHNVCNRCVAAPAAAGALCDCCRFNVTVPDLKIDGNWQKWQLLEAAKRRLFYDLDLLGLPYGTAADGIHPPLAFDFKADVIPATGFWRAVGKSESVYTGHAEGRITINIREADAVEREKLRVDLGEAKRTLIGHFRHEIGHYYWEQLVRGRREDACRAVFGNHDQPSYAEALDTYYQNGPPGNWSEQHISAYATMHPWEDFAETWAAYLHMVSELDTAHNVGFGGETDPVHADLENMVRRYQELGIALNEINRSMGLIDLVPEVFVPPVVEKLRYIHQLVLEWRGENGILKPAGAA
ncbi:MAG: putative zinc-binding peptidase [Planctomycetia bacterium]|nr:putative zinc-binding peptidase [Planctomycetia bacterium]